MDRIMQCNQLLIQAPRMIVDFGRVAQAGIPLARRQQVADTYLEWYTLGQRVILDELRTYFESRYTAAIGGSLSIQDMLIRLVSTAEDDLRHLWVQSVGFKWSVEEQCEVLRMTDPLRHASGDCNDLQAPLLRIQYRAALRRERLPATLVDATTQGSTLETDDTCHGLV
jgi:hypothetical protein